MRALAILVGLAACTTPGVVIPDDGSDPDLSEPEPEPDQRRDQKDRR